MERHNIDPKMLLYHLYRYDITGEVLIKEILDKHGALVGWYREYRKDITSNDGDNNEKIYQEVNWFLTKHVLARMDICPNTIDIRIWKRGDIAVTKKFFKITEHSLGGIELFTADITAYSQVTELRAPQDESYYKQYFDVIGLLETSLS